MYLFNIQLSIITFQIRKILHKKILWEVGARDSRPCISSTYWASFKWKTFILLLDTIFSEMSEDRDFHASTVNRLALFCQGKSHYSPLENTLKQENHCLASISSPFFHAFSKKNS